MPGESTNESKADWRVLVADKFLNASVGVVAIIVFGYVLNKQADNQAQQTAAMKAGMEAQTRAAAESTAALRAISDTYTGRSTYRPPQ